MKKSRPFIVGACCGGLAAITAGLVIFLFAAGTDSRARPSVADLALIGGIIEIVERDYVHPIPPSELTTDALKGMLGRLDPHSDYMDETEFKESQADLSGKFGGLGIQISTQNGIPKVISPIDDTPAARAGLAPGDLIVAVDGQSTHGIELTKVVRILRGDPGTSVKLTISRGEKPPFDVSITRAIIQVPSVKSKMLANNVGWVRITEFGSDTPKDFESAIANLKKDAGGQLRGLVIDLRNDPGGLLTSAISVAGNFLEGGTVVSVKGRHKDDDRSFPPPGNGDVIKGVPIVVLINGASASASEIVAGALQDRKRATIMGTQTFGKGSVQSVIPLRGHGALRLTTALYYTPAGRSIQGEGIAPDIVVEAPKDQQVAAAVMLRENELHGAFANPGSISGTKTKKGAAPTATPLPPAKPPADNAALHSPPIKADLIGTPDDAQLKAALEQLARMAAN